MKNIYIIAILLFSNTSFIFSQEFKSGYLTFKDGTVLTTDILVTKNNSLYIRYKAKDTSSKKVKKSQLTDFGYIINGKKKSKHAAFGFKKAAKDAFYITQNNDTVPFYFTNFAPNSIEGYFQDRSYDRLSPKNIKSVTVFDKKKTTTFDALNIQKYYKKFNLFNYQFLERISGGEIMLYSLTFNKTEIKKMGKVIEDPTFLDYLFAYGEDPNRIGKPTYQTQKRAVFIHVLIKNQKLTFLPFTNISPLAEVQLKQMVQDHFELYEKIGQKGYKYEDMHLIIKEYNSYWSKVKNNN